MSDAKAPHAGTLHWVRADDFEEKYANNVSFESSAWDLKILFGTLDQGAPDPRTYPSCVKYHAAISIPWRQAKLMAYSACMNVLWHERSEGAINVGSLPPSVDALVKSVAETPAGRKLIELDKMLRAVLFGEEER